MTGCLGVVSSSGSCTLALDSQEGNGFWHDVYLSQVSGLALFATYPVHEMFGGLRSISNHEIYISSSQSRVDHSTSVSDWVLNNFTVIVRLYAWRRIDDFGRSVPVILAVPNAAKDDIF